MAAELAHAPAELINITSMVYVKNSFALGWSGPYSDYRVTKDGIFVLNPGMYTFVLYGPLHIAVRPCHGRTYVLQNALSMELRQYELVRLLHVEPMRELYDTTVLLLRNGT